MSNRSSHLELAASLIEQYVPIYEPGQWDPLIAAEQGRGSCFAKNVIGSVIIDNTCLINTVTGIQWGSRNHPRTSRKSMLGQTELRPGHSSLLVAKDNSPHFITAISFNDNYRRKDQWTIYPFNEPDTEPLAAVQNGQINLTDVGRTVGISIYPWYEAGQKYTEALGIRDSVFHTNTKQDIERFILEIVKNDPIVREIPR